jgi:hypothetical protein
MKFAAAFLFLLALTGCNTSTIRLPSTGYGAGATKTWWVLRAPDGNDEIVYCDADQKPMCRRWSRL